MQNSSQNLMPNQLSSNLHGLVYEEKTRPHQTNHQIKGSVMHPWWYTNAQATLLGNVLPSNTMDHSASGSDLGFHPKAAIQFY